MIFKKLFLPVLWLTSVAVVAQDAGAKKFAAAIQPQALRQHLETIAGPSTEGRETATAGERKAATYIQEEFKRLGLKPGNGNSYLMPFNVYKDSVTQAGLNVNGSECSINNDFGVLTDFNHACDLKFSTCVFAGYGISTNRYDEYQNLDVAGKLVIVYEGEPRKNGKYLLSGNTNKTRWSYSTAKAEAATQHGAAGLLIIRQHFSSVPEYNQWSDVYIDEYRTYQQVNTFFISEKVAIHIFGKNYGDIVQGLKADTLKKMEGVPANIALTYQRQMFTLTSNNVLGVLEGTDKKDEYVFLTAHYDHLGKHGGEIYYGADDDGSGTVSVLQLAQAFVNAKKAGKGPRRSIVFMLVSGEEKGLWGSDYYTSHPIYPLEKTTVDLNIDMIGRTGFEYDKNKDSVNYVYVIGDDKLSSDLRPISEKNNKATGLRLDYKYNDLNDPNYFYYRSDHYNFAKHGVPIIFYTDGEHKDYHKPSDTVDRINFNLLSKRAKLVFYTAWEMANMDRMLKRDIPLK